MALAILKKFSLEGIAEGWTDACHVMCRAATYADIKALRDVDDKITDLEATERLVTFVQDHVASGKVLRLLDDGTTELSDITKAEVLELPVETLMSIFNEMNGGKLDPKGTDSAAPSEPAPTNSEATTTTS